LTSYVHKNARLDIKNNRAKLYIDERMVFQGSGYLGITQFVNYCNDPKVTNQFKAQLESRETPKFLDIKKE
tara:strand:+ start:210 stop:422 length:213 start_codon:yes stop_codon:yes gene_type:complete